MTDQEIFQKLSELKKRDITLCLATVVECTGSTPREIGAKMIVCADGTIHGTVGGGCGENQVHSAALRAILQTKSPVVVEVDLTDDLGTKGGAVCGGKMRVFVEPI
jgi:xanthine dehydrogenase accessory factor